jgi:cytidine deaminase
MEHEQYRRVFADIIIMCLVFYKGNGNLTKARILSYGINQMGDSDGLNPGVHAEHDAIIKLCPLKKKKRLEIINILVIRVSSKNKLQSSKPCGNCLEIMKTLPMKKGYKIQNVYYSDNEGNIIKKSLTNLDNEDNRNKHYSRYYKQRKRFLE